MSSSQPTDDTPLGTRVDRIVNHALASQTEVATRVVLDTSVLVADPACIYNFSGCDVVIPLTVIEELDGLKTRMDDVGRSARTALRSIEDLRKKAGGSLASPTRVHDGPDSGTVQIEVNGVQRNLLVEHGLDPDVPDNRIIGAALGQARPGHPRSAWPSGPNRQSASTPPPWSETPRQSVQRVKVASCQRAWQS